VWRVQCKYVGHLQTETQRYRLGRCGFRKFGSINRYTSACAMLCATNNSKVVGFGDRLTCHRAPAP